jgi:hypothetical protein
MAKFKALLFKFLPNEAHYNFCDRVSSVLAAGGTTIATVLGALLNEFNAWLAKEKALIEWVKRSLLTAKIAEADHLQDQALVAFSAYVRALLHSLDADVAEAAQAIANMLRNYGKVYSKPYEDQTGDMKAILSLLHGTYATNVTKCGLDDYVAAIQDAFEEFQTLLAQRDTQSLQKPAESFPVVRRGIEAVYHKITFLIDSAAALDTPPAFTAVINKLNPEIERLNNEHHRARKNLGMGDHTVIEPIDTQKYTEKAVTPIPKVYYRENGKPTIELAFAKDFSVTYKNNVKVGMAALTINGKGEYKGQKSTTFNIAR